MKNIFNFLRFVVSITLLIFMMYLSHISVENKYCTLSNISIEQDENSFVTNDLVVSYLRENMLHPDSIKLNEFSFTKIENLLINHPSIKKATVYSNWHGKVSIYIDQRQPIVRIQTDEGGYYLDEDGLKMPLSSNYTARKILLTGDINSLNKDEIFLISKRIYNDKFLNKQIVQIDVKESELSLIPRVGEQIEFGKIKNINEKFMKLMMYYKHGNIKNVEYKKINIKYKNQIVCIKK